MRGLSRAAQTKALMDVSRCADWVHDVSCSLQYSIGVNKARAVLCVIALPRLVLGEEVDGGILVYVQMNQYTHAITMRACSISKSKKRYSSEETASLSFVYEYTDGDRVRCCDVRVSVCFTFSTPNL